VNNERVQALIREAQSGDDEARDALIRKYRNWAELLARRSRWGGSPGPDGDEVSIALLALNEAIDTYRPGAKSFRSFADMVVTNRLRDHYRRESRHRHVPLAPTVISDEEDAAEHHRKEELRQAWMAYEEEQAARERRRELVDYQRELERFGVKLHELPSVSPRHQDTRLAIVAIARVLIDDEKLRDRFLDTGLVPLTELSEKVKFSKKTIKRWRKFVVAVAVLLAHPDWEQLGAFFDVRFRKSEAGADRVMIEGEAQ